jgi:hypothetical protein
MAEGFTPKENDFSIYTNYEPAENQAIDNKLNTACRNAIMDETVAGLKQESANATVALDAYGRAFAYFASFAIPALAFMPQLAVGTAVNFIIIYSAPALSWAELLPILVLPSFGALVGGYIFGQSTPMIALLIPAIWAGNAIIAHFSKKYLGAGSVSGLATGALAKAGALFTFAGALYLFGMLPQAFLLAFGPLQLITAACGAGLALVAKKFVH